MWSLWALGVGAVISGDFSGWNLGIQYSGFGGYLVAMFIVTLMYLGLCYSIAEMSPALPHTGGAYSFGRTAMGVWELGARWQDGRGPWALANPGW